MASKPERSTVGEPVPKSSEYIELASSHYKYLASMDFGHFQQILDEIFPAFGEFTIGTAPQGFPPEWIRNQWIGVKLPVRMHNEIGMLSGTKVPHNSVPIIAREALEALKEQVATPESEIAYDWWANYFFERAELFNLQLDEKSHPASFANWDVLYFDINCGSLAITNPQRLCDGLDQNYNVDNQN